MSGIRNARPQCDGNDCRRRDPPQDNTGLFSDRDRRGVRGQGDGLRRILNPMGTTDAVEFLLSKLKQTKTNGEFFDSMNS